MGISIKNTYKNLLPFMIDTFLLKVVKDLFCNSYPSGNYFNLQLFIYFIYAYILIETSYTL